MTTLTGKTECKYETTLKPPPFSLTVFGAVLQLSVTVFVWSNYTSAGPCLANPIDCFLAQDKKGDHLGRQIVLLLGGTFLMWAYCFVDRFRRGATHSDPSYGDRLWSVLPVLYTFGFAFASSFHPRNTIMLALVLLWGGRLTWNFLRKGGFSAGGEDYRWEEVRSWFAPWQYEIFFFLFVCFFQQAVIFAFTTPAAVAMAHPVPLNAVDAAAAALFLLLFLGETVADEQMFRFQTEKYRLIAIHGRDKLPEPYAAGFVQSGLWSVSRHPNYLCEISMWWAFYLFSLAATTERIESEGLLLWTINWSVLGPFFLTLLFVPPMASVDLTEYLSSRKYPRYKDYQQRVSRLLPWFPLAQPKSKSS